MLVFCVTLYNQTSLFLVRLHTPPGERRISEISPPLFSGSGLYKNLSFSRPMSIFCLPEPLLSPFTKLFPPFFIASSFFCSLCRFKAQPMDSLLVCFAKHIVHNFVVVKLTQFALQGNLCDMCMLGRLGNWALKFGCRLYQVF